MKRQIFAEWTQNYNPTIYCLQETYFKYNDLGLLQEGEKKAYHANIKYKNAGYINPDKVDFRVKKITRDKEGCYIMIKTMYQEDTVMLNI